MFERPILLWLLLATPLIAMPGATGDATGKGLDRGRRRNASGAGVCRAGICSEWIRNSNPDLGAASRDGRAHRSVALNRTRSTRLDA